MAGKILQTQEDRTKRTSFFKHALNGKFYTDTTDAEKVTVTAINASATMTVNITQRLSKIFSK